MADFGSALWNKPAAADSTPAEDPVTRSLRFDGGAYFSRSTGSTSTTWTLSFWVKRATISGPSQQQYIATWAISGSAGEGIAFRGTADSSNLDKIGFWTGSTQHYSTAVYRDPAAWAHICISVNSGTATVYYNGESILSGMSGIQAWGSMRLGSWLNQNELEGYMADVYGIEGSALDHTSFTESNDYGGLKPKAYTGEFGTNGFHLDAQPSNSADLLVSSIDRNDGDTTFADAAKGHGLVRYGSTHHDDTVGNPFDSSGTAIHFDGSGDYIKVWDGSSGDYDFGTADYTIECWVNISSSSSSNYNTIFSNSNTGLHLFERGGEFYYYTGSDGGTNPSNGLTGYTANTWYHVAAVRDGTNIRVYINGKCSLNYTWNGTTDASTSNFRIGGGDHYYLDGYIYDFRVTGGEALYSGTSTASDWANFDEITAPFELNPVYIGGDQSGNKNHFTPTNISGHDVMLDVPYPKNYATLNPLDAGGGTFSEGNLKWAAGGSHRAVRFTQAALAGDKTYFEVYFPDSWSNQPMIGLMGAEAKISDHQSANPSLWFRSNGYEYNNGSESNASNPTWTNGDIVGVAVDLSAGELKYRVNNGSFTTAFTGLSSSTTWIPAIKGYDTSPSYILNTGADPTFAGNKTSGQDTSQSEFYYAPPSGFQALNSSNLTAYVTPSEHFDILTYTGNSDVNYGSGSTQNVTGVNFDVGMAWIKDRDNSSSGYTYSGYDEYGHYLFDTVTGTSSGGYNLDGDVVSSGSGTTLNSGYYGVTSFSAGSGTSRGITVDEAGETNFDYDDGYYTLTERYVAWLWKLGSTGSSSTWNSSYTAPSTEHYNADAGVTTIEVSPVSSGNLEVAHSLSAAPEFFFVGTDSYADFSGYPAFHKDLTSGYYLQLDGSAAQSSGSTYFPSGAAHADYIKLGSVFADTYGYGGNLRIWAFTGVEGYSKFGTYKGAGSNGVFVYTGHRPKMVWIKNMDTTGNWFIFDAVRDTYNETVNYLHANSSTSETTNSGYKIDVLSNGFKINVESTHMNNSAYDYVFCSFAESPFKHANAR